MEKIYRLSDYIFDFLSHLKVQHVFFLPGGGAMHLNDALAQQKKIKSVSCNHEQACGIAAESYGRVGSRRFGVALVTTGPGATNIITPFVGAWIDSIPLLVISGQVKSTDIKPKELRQNGVQEVDIISMVKDKAKYAKTLTRASNIKKELTEIIKSMLQGRPGPAWLDIPLDIQAKQVGHFKKADLDFLVEMDAVKTIRIQVEKKINILLSDLKQSKRPLLLIGNGVRVSGAVPIFKQLIKELKIPCVFTWNAMDILDSSNQYNIGRPGVVAQRAPNFAIQNCDLLIVVGCRVDNIITAYSPDNFAKHAIKYAVDVDPQVLNSHQVNFKNKLNLDAASFFKHIFNAKVSVNCQAWMDRCSSWKRKFTSKPAKMKFKKNAISHYGFFEELSNQLNAGQVIATGSSGLAVELFYLTFRNKKDQRIFLTSGLGSMGYGLPSSIGACYGIGMKRVVCVESDGSLMLNLQELYTLKGLDLPIALIILNNNGYASIKNTQRNYFNSRFIGVDSKSGLFVADYEKLADSLSIEYVAVRTHSDFIKLKKIKTFNKPIIFNVFLNPEELLEPKAIAIPQKDGSMISMPLEDMSPLLSLEELLDNMIYPIHPNSIKVREK